MRGETSEKAEESAAEKTLRTTRWRRSPPDTVKKEFNGFMAKRFNPQSTGDLTYEQESPKMRKKI